MEHLKNRRAEDRRSTAALAVDCVADPRGSERRRLKRRLGDAHSVAETLATQYGSIVTMLSLRGGSRERQCAVYGCGCVAVDPDAATAFVQLLQCPTHAALQAKLRRRRTDHH